MVVYNTQLHEDSLLKILKKPILLYAGQIANEPDWNFPSHKHEDVSEIIYISEGDGEFIINDKIYKAHEGDLLIYNKGIIHEERTNPQNPLKTYFCGVGNLHIENIPEGCILPLNIEPVIHANEYKYKIENYISNIFEESTSQILGFDLICERLVSSLIVLITRIITSINGHTSSIVPVDTITYQIKDYIDRNYTEEISLSKIANRLYISPHYLSHVFKNNTGCSPINYIITRRVNDAKKLLLTTNMSVQEIATKVGYENANYFTMLFKKVTGTTPSKFKSTKVK